MSVRLSKDGIFYTLQGEGPLSGVPSLFVRLDTCNLKCKWGDTICDAHYTSWNPSGSVEDLDKLQADVATALREKGCKHLVITGGEPTLQPDAVRALALTPTLWHSTLETNGTRFVPDHHVDLICLSPKLSSSTPVGTAFEKVHERNRWQPDVIRQWMESSAYYFKIVIDQEKDVSEACHMLAEVGQALEPEHVLFMPQGIDSATLWERGRWLAEVCKELGVRFAPRIQIDLWGNRPGT